MMLSEGTREGFEALLELYGKTYEFNGVGGEILPANLESLDFEVKLQQGESLVQPARFLRDAWIGQGVPKVGNHLTRESDDRKFRVAAMLDDGVSETIRMVLAV